MFTLNSKSKANIEERTGLSTDQISVMSWEQIDSSIEKKTGKKIRLAPPIKPCLVGRGSVDISQGRLIPPGEIDKKLARI